MPVYPNGIGSGLRNRGLEVQVLSPVPQERIGNKNMKYKIRLDTISDANEFVAIASTIKGYVIIADGNGLRVNGKSILGALHAMEFSSLYCESDTDIYHRLNKFIIEE